MSTSGVPSGIKVVFIFLINLKLTKTKEIPEMIRIKPNKELRSIDIGKENKRIICNTKLANKMIGGKVIFINQIYQKNYSKLNSSSRHSGVMKVLKSSSILLVISRG